MTTQDIVEVWKQRMLEEGIQKGLKKGIEKGRSEGIEKGIEKGRNEGIEKGRSEGQLVEARSALRRVLSRRKLALSAAEEAKIEACADLTTLERWHDEAVIATSAAEALR